MTYIRDKFLIALISPSAGGKSAILREVLKLKNGISYSVSYTTRPPRFNEQNHRDYHFVSLKEFEERKANCEFLEFAQVHDYWYGTSRRFVSDQLSKGQHVIMDIDVCGALQLIENKVDMVSIFILPPNRQELINRLKARETETKQSIKRRLQTAESELKKIDFFDYLVINDNLELAVQDVLKIIKAEELRIKRYQNILQTYYGE